MFHTKLFPLLKYYHKFLEVLGNTVYKIDEDGEYIVKSKSKKESFIAKFLGVFDVTYCIMVAIHLGFSTHLRLDEKFQGMPIYLVYISLGFSKYVWTFDIGGVQLLNSLMNFEREYFDEDIRGVIKGSKLVKAIHLQVLIMEFTGAIFPVVAAVLTLSNPCVAPFLSSFSRDCRFADGMWLLDLENNMGSTLTRLGMALMDAIICAEIVTGKIVNIYVLIVTPALLVAYFPLVKQGYRGIYGPLEILVRMLNDFAMQQVFPLFMAAITWVQIMSMYACIIYHGKLPYATFAVFPLLVVDTVFVNMVLYTLESLIYKKSADTLEMWKKDAAFGGGTGKYLKLAVRKIWAKQPMKIKFGSNFVDSGTPLAIQDFCINQLVNLTLISK